jgi:hypothetical protein
VSFSAFLNRKLHFDARGFMTINFSDLYKRSRWRRSFSNSTPTSSATEGEEENIAVKRELTDELTVTDKLAVCPPRTSDESEEAALYTDRFWFEKRRHALLLSSILLAEDSW